jgi:hypothetical protein
MEYPVLTVLLFAILISQFFDQYTLIKYRRKLFSFSTAVLGTMLLFVIPVLKLMFSEYDTIFGFQILYKESNV